METNLNMNQISSNEVDNGSDGPADAKFKDDDNIEEILNKRPALVDNPYYKNLREDSQSAGIPANVSKRASFQANDTQADTTSNKNKGNIGSNVNLIDSSLNANNMNLFTEKTFLSFSSLGDQAEESDDDTQDNDSLDGGISRYEDACHGLMIGTSSIVLKSLKTNSVILSNYGLNSVRVLALCNALKVITFLLFIKL